MLPQHVDGASSVWRQDVEKAPVAANSGNAVRKLTAQVTGAYNGVAAFNAYQYNPTWYSVAPDQATTTFSFDNCQNKSSQPSGLFGGGGQFTDVPVPADAVPSVGSDGTLTIYRGSTDQLWDFWRVKHTGNHWSACWGGRLDHVSHSQGIFPFPYGAAATGLASELGTVSIRDVESGGIDHALALAIPQPAVSTRLSWPALRSDGFSSDPDALPEGTRLRLDPSIDVDALHLGPIAAMIAKAAQKYGFIVSDRSDGVAVTAESGAPVEQDTGVNPWQQLLDGTPTYDVMADFPWSRLQVLPQSYGKP